MGAFYVHVHYAMGGKGEDDEYGGQAGRRPFSFRPNASALKTIVRGLIKTNARYLLPLDNRIDGT